jgi:hypothetical protein
VDRAARGGGEARARDCRRASEDGGRTKGEERRGGEGSTNLAGDARRTRGTTKLGLAPAARRPPRPHAVHGTATHQVGRRGRTRHVSGQPVTGQQQPSKQSWTAWNGTCGQRSSIQRRLLRCCPHKSSNAKGEKSQYCFHIMCEVVQP